MLVSAYLPGMCVHLYMRIFERSYMQTYECKGGRGGIAKAGPIFRGVDGTPPVRPREKNLQRQYPQKYEKIENHQGNSTNLREFPQTGE